MRLPLRFCTWHWEMTFVAVVMVGTVIVTGPSWMSLAAALAVLASFGHASVADRLLEASVEREASPVHCHAWLNRYWVAKEVLWVVFFVATGAWPALVGCGVFLAYPFWRREYRRRRPRRLPWLEEVYALTARNRGDEAIDLLFSKVDAELRAARFEALSGVLQAVDVERLDSGLMVALLAITRSAKEELPHRATLLTRIEKCLAEKMPDRAERLLRRVR